MAMEVAAQHNWTEMAEETVEEALIERRARRSANDDVGAVNEDELSSSDEEEANKDKTKNSVYNEGLINLNAVDFHVVLNGDRHETGNHANGDLLSGVCLPPETGNPKGEIISGVCVPLLHGQNETGKAKEEILSDIIWSPPSIGHDSESSASVRKGSENERIIDEKVVEEEVVELEFFDTAAVDKIQHTHNAYCPNCSSRITKVVLRRVKRERRILIETDDDRHDQKSDLLGCLSCFSVFVRIGKKLNPFPIFGSGEGTNSTEPHLPNTNEGSSHNPCETLDGQNGQPSSNRGLPSTKDNATEHKPPSPTPPAKGPIHQGSLFDLAEEGGFIPGPMPSKKSPAEIIENKGNDYRIPILEDPIASPSTVNSSSPRRPVFPVEVGVSRSLEIVKCIVYGGLIEAITSLGVVSSAAAADADTMKIVTIGVANLIGGLFVICQNLVDLKNSVEGGSNQVDRYREQLGQRKHFLLHAIFAMLSYFVFGLVPPVIYGFTFRKSDDRDYKLIAVAAASLLCVIILAAAKAYTRGANKFSKYFKTILSYVIAAGMASGVAYAAGHLIQRLMDDLGWFDSKPISQNSAWASY